MPALDMRKSYLLYGAVPLALPRGMDDLRNFTSNGDRLFAVRPSSESPGYASLVFVLVATGY